jgi:two-component system invasion response regulator UvrY
MAQAVHGGLSQVCSILLVDDQAAFRQLARALLSAHPAVLIVGEATSGEEALSLLPTLKPDAVILDVQLPGMNGFEAAWRMLELSPGLRVVIISGYDFQYEALARTVGAVAFLPKKQFSTEAILSALELP